jgi:hypothetical protein
LQRTARFVITLIAILAIGIVGTNAATPAKNPTSQEIAQRILTVTGGKYMSPAAHGYLESVARNDRNVAPASVTTSGGVPLVPAAAPGAGAALVPLVGLPNVRVNNPAEDSHQTDQTTQSETSLAVSGTNVAVGFNDSQSGFFFLTAGGDLVGYAYSTDGGLTFTDGGVLPNGPGLVNVSDPWLASDSGGTMYFSVLSIDVTRGVLVGFSRSTNGGKTWSPTAAIPPPPPLCSAKGCGSIFYLADKDALTAGPGKGNVYDVWDDITYDPNTGNSLSGLPVAHSTNGGQSWTITYAAQKLLSGPGTGCSFSQFVGAQPLVASGVVYDVAEVVSSNDPLCAGAPVNLSEAVYFSKDGGATWSPGGVVPITSSTRGLGAFQLGTGMLMRNIEFPTLASFKGNVYVAWNDGGDGSGHSHIRLGQLNSLGQFASIANVTSGTRDEIQPALTADTAGLHLAYYQLSVAANGAGRVDVMMSNSTNGKSFSVRRVTSQSFPGVFTYPQFDPLVGPAYMGDYIAIADDGTHQYIAWGDNRDIITNFLWPQGRNDPDIFFAKQ